MKSPLAFGSLRGKRKGRSDPAARFIRGEGLGVALSLSLVAAIAQAQPLATKLPTTDVTIGGERFAPEVARDPATQFRGLGGRTLIDSHGGMLFVFPFPRQAAFVMRDCPIPIDIAFVDAAGRVIAIHEMQPEPPRRPDESAFAYDGRLKQYPSGAPALFAIETAGGRLRALGLKPGDHLDITP